MAKKVTPGQDALGAFAPKFAQLNDEVLWFSHLSIEIPGVDTSDEWLEPVDDTAYAALG